MLTKIRTKWVEPWLERDLYQQARLELQLTGREDAVQTRLRSYSQTGGDPGPEIPRDKPIKEIFDDASGQLLILGEPGTGKSTKLVELARALLHRAAADASEPIPVILYLSSWTKKQAGLGEWLQAELVRLYKVGPDRARQWVEGRDILPLLDGLDELAKDQRADCVEAINTWSDLKSLAVCCRLEEYRKLPVALSLAGAVVVEPLEREEVESYLKKHGSKLQSVRQALQDDPKLWDLMKTPLMLSVLFWASAVEWDEARNEPDLRRRLYLRFVHRMFDRHQNSRFDKKKACRWLGWLAAQLVNRDQIPFALEDLDWEWLPSRRARRAASVIFGLVFGLVGGLVGGLDAILRPAAVSERSAANEGTSRSLLYAVRISSAGVVLAIAVAWLLSVPRGGLEGAMSGAVEAATAAAPAMVAWLSVFLALQKGGFFFLRHWAVRAQLQRLGLAPRHYVKFLDEAAAMLFLRKTGGTYQFFHVTFRDFVAETYGAEWLAKDRRPPPPKQAAST